MTSTDDYAEDIALGNAKVLAEAGLLTEREAQAYVLTRFFGWDVKHVADILDVSKSRIYNARDTAAADIKAAQETLDMLNELADDPVWTPTHCAKCGDGLDDWTVADGHVVCLDCANEL